MDYTVTFADPNVLLAEGSYSVERTTTTLGQTEVQNVENLIFATDGTWMRNGNELIFVTDGEEQSYTITELTATTMTISTVDVSTVVESGFTYVVNTNLIATDRR